MSDAVSTELIIFQEKINQTSSVSQYLWQVSKRIMKESLLWLKIFLAHSFSLKFNFRKLPIRGRGLTLLFCSNPRASLSLSSLTSPWKGSSLNSKESLTVQSSRPEFIL